MKYLLIENDTNYGLVFHHFTDKESLVEFWIEEEVKREKYGIWKEYELLINGIDKENNKDKEERKLYEAIYKEVNRAAEKILEGWIEEERENCKRALIEEKEKVEEAMRVLRENGYSEFIKSEDS